MFRELLIVTTLFTYPAVADEGLDRVMSKVLFDRSWVQARSTTRASDGLGPLFNARSCAACHPAGGAAGFRAVDGKLTSVGLVARFGDGLARGDAFYGIQLQNSSVPSIQPEGTVAVDPKGHIHTELNHRDLKPGTGIGLRRAPTLAGRGLIDSVSELAILDMSDPDDANGDGISGRPSFVRDGHVGRFGWKAEHVTIGDQIAAAFSFDIGLSSARFQDHFADCTVSQVLCRLSFDGSDSFGDGYELTDDLIDLVGKYVSSLGTERQGSPMGARLFQSVGCAACHQSTLTTDDGSSVGMYSDLLLHDMGPGLEDGFDLPNAQASEWRTAPLIGLSTSRSRFLHDGRAANILDAIEWHGGEATTSIENFRKLDDDTAHVLLEFVGSL